MKNNPSGRKSIWILFFLFMMVLPRMAYAGGMPLIMQGVSKTLFSVFKLPGDMISATGRSFPFGIVSGAVTGATKAVGGTMMGAVDMARGAAPYAKYMIFFV